MGFGQTDHGFELTSCGCDATFGCANVFAEFPHCHVGAYEGVGGGLGDYGVDVGAGVGDVGCEEFDGLGEGLLVFAMGIV